MKRSRFNNLITYLIIPLAAVWSELAIHIRMKTELQFSPLYIVFGLSAGLFFSILQSLLNRKAEKTVRIITLFLLWLIFAAESVGYMILQAYYPVSSLGTAAENRLYDYMDIILATIRDELVYLLILLVPFVLGCLIPARDLINESNNRFKGKKNKQPGKATGKKLTALILTVLLVFGFHYLGKWMITLDWGGGDLTPEKLYYMDENLELQEERLGLLTMLRLDILHMLFPDTVAVPDISIIPEEPEPEPVEIIPDPIDRSPHVMDVDLDALSESSDSKVAWLASYMKSVKPTKKNEYTGMLEGYNVVFLSLEAFSGYAINEKLTPTLYKLSNECFVFNNFYTPLYYGSTNAGECQNLLGLYPKQGSPMSLQESGRLGTNCYFSLGPQLGKLGYHNIGFHNGWEMYDRSRTMKNLGYSDWHYLGNGLKAEKTSSGGYKWPQRDTFMIENTIDMYVYDDVPFNAYYMTISGHTPFSWSWVALQYKDILSEYDWSSTTRAYVATVMEVDRALEALLKGLEEAGQLEKTLIVAVADHMPYSGVEILGELTGNNFGTSDMARNCNERYLDTEVYRNTLIMWAGSMEERVVVDKICTQVDILPTVLNLLGIEYDSRMLAGSDMLSNDPGLVIFYSKSWRSDNGLYNSFTQEFTQREGLHMSDEAIQVYVENMNKIVECKSSMTQMILQTDFYDLVFGG